MLQYRPLLLFALAFAVGIAAAAQHAPPLEALYGAALASLALIGAAGRSWRAAAAGVILMGFAFGALRLTVFQQVAPDDASHWAGRSKPVALQGTIVSDPERRAGRVTCLVQAERIAEYGHVTVATGEVYASIGADALPPSGVMPSIGERVVLQGRLDLPRPASNPGAFSWRDYLARRAVYSRILVGRRDAFQSAGPSASQPLMQCAERLRRRLLEVIESSLPTTEAAVLSGILFGDRAGLSPSLLAEFVQTGAVHILATAGLHVGIVAYWLMRLSERLTLPRKTGVTLVILTLCLYGALCGDRPAVTRAVLMAVLYFGAVLFEREPDLPTVVAAAALFILCGRPTALLEPGFQLSFLTVLTLAVTMPLWTGFWRPQIERRFADKPALRRALLRAVELTGLTVLAQAGAAPIVAASYNEVSLSGIAANLLVVPALFVLIPLGILAVLTSMLWPPVGGALFTPVAWLLKYILLVVHFFSIGPWAYRAVVTPPPFCIALYYASICAAAFLLHRRTNGMTLPGPVS